MCLPCTKPCVRWRDGSKSSVDPDLLKTQSAARNQENWSSDTLSGLSAVSGKVKAQDVMGTGHMGISTTCWVVREGFSLKMKLLKGMILPSLGVGYRKTGVHLPAGGRVNEGTFKGSRLLIIAKALSSNQQRSSYY